jgi:hypothetical protein
VPGEDGRFGERGARVECECDEAVPEIVQADRLATLALQPQRFPRPSVPAPRSMSRQRSPSRLANP